MQQENRRSLEPDLLIYLKNKSILVIQYEIPIVERKNKGLLHEVINLILYSPGSADIEANGESDIPASLVGAYISIDRYVQIT